jgi:uncharacterized protein YcbK (DUF882 family)
VGDLTRNFSSREFTCRHCGRLRLDPALLAGLQALRDRTGVPIDVTSGYRCPDHPVERGKPRPGYHSLGMAADIIIRRHTLREMYEAAEGIPAFSAGGIGIYDGGFIHVDVRASPSRWGRVKGQYVSIEEAAATIFKH